MSKRSGGCWTALMVLVGCGASPQPEATAPASVGVAAAPTSSGAPKAPEPPLTEHVCPCKAHLTTPQACISSPDDVPSRSCFVFPSPQAALAQALSEKPQILAIGETHALAKHGKVLSTTARFQGELLPELKDFRAMIVEALIPPQGCAAEEQRAREQTAEVTKPQASTNQNELLALAGEAKKQGIMPYPLRLSCAEVKAIGSGNDGVEQALRLIAEKTKARAVELIERREAPLLTYGGMMHNDLEPKAGREAWSFGPALSALSAKDTSPSYIELDLVTREFIADRSPWTELGWYTAYLQNCKAEGTILIRQSPRSFVLIFPWQTPDGAKSCSESL